jgi:hypothetical protein
MVFFLFFAVYEKEAVSQGTKERQKTEIAAKRHKTHKKADLGFVKRTFTAPLWNDGNFLDRWLSHGCRLTIQFFELFVPFCGYFWFLSCLCSLREVFLLARL